MGLFKLVSKVASVFKRHSCRTTGNKQPPARKPGPDISTSITYSGHQIPVTDIPDEDVATITSRYAFVVSRELPLLDTAHQWWNEETHKRRMRDASAEAYAWLAPFLPVGLVQREQLQSVIAQWGPLHSHALAKELRERIRMRRLHKQPCEDLLRALYGACVMIDFMQSLKFEGYQPHAMARHVDIDDLRAVDIDYASMGYQCIESLGKIDRKWLVEAFGEPAEHQSFSAAFPAPWQNAISRFYWSELDKANNAARTLGTPPLAMQEWLHERVKLKFGYHKDWQERLADNATWDADVRTALRAAWLAATQDFVVAAIETSGVNAEADEVLEIAAVRASPTGEILAEFSAAVTPAETAPGASTIFAGISRDGIAKDGCRTEEAMSAYLKFAGSSPVFFHNAPFSMRFLKKIALETGQHFSNRIHDSLPLARAAWPERGCYKLDALTGHIGTDAPSHHALSKAKATLSVLLAARKVATAARFFGRVRPELELRRDVPRDFRAALSLPGQHAFDSAASHH